jgi:hypothetical protein
LIQALEGIFRIPNCEEEKEEKKMYDILIVFLYTVFRDEIGKFSYIPHSLFLFYVVLHG